MEEEIAAYLDANLFVFLLAYAEETQEHKAALAAMELLLKSKTNMVTSTLTWDEVAHAISKTIGRESAVKEAGRLLQFPRLYFSPVTKATTLKAQELFKEGLQPRDAIHAAAALENNCLRIVSNDKAFDKVKGLKRIPI